MTQMIDNIYWVGYVDWSIRNFHSYEIPDGATYNSYLIIDEEPTLVDTVKELYADCLIDKINRVPNMDISKIKNIICLHAEPDHSGSLQQLYTVNPNITIYCSVKCLPMLNQYYPGIPNEAIITVEDNEKLKIGKKTLTFKMTPFQHWPEQMAAYLDEEKVLFGSDSFGQHIASTQRWADEFDVNRVIMRMEDYFANILNPFTKAIVKNSTFMITGGFKYILTAHGLCFRGPQVQVAIDVYSNILSEKHKQDKVLILYDSMYGSTQLAAQKISHGVSAKGYKPVLLNLQHTPVAECALQMFQSRAIAIGSPTLNGLMMPNVKAALMYLQALRLLNNAPCLIFGAYCWNPMAMEDIRKTVKQDVNIRSQIAWQLKPTPEIEAKLFKAGGELVEYAQRELQRKELKEEANRMIQSNSGKRVEIQAE